MASRQGCCRVQISATDGCHIPSMGGTWMLLTYGFGGMRDDDGTFSFWPRRAPEDNAMLRFPVMYRGQYWKSKSGWRRCNTGCARANAM